ncbi:MAG: hypothetical protein Q9227_002647 [Pyrenula ochraceoflavens]
MTTTVEPMNIHTQAAAAGAGGDPPRRPDGGKEPPPETNIWHAPHTSKREAQEFRDLANRKGGLLFGQTMFANVDIEHPGANLMRNRKSRQRKIQRRKKKRAQKETAGTADTKEKKSSDDSETDNEPQIGDF